MSLNRILSLVAGCLALLLSSLAQAYVNPGAGMTFLGALLGFLAFFLFLLVGIFLWPIRRYLQHRREKQEQQAYAKTPPDSPDKPA